MIMAAAVTSKDTSGMQMEACSRWLRVDEDAGLIFVSFSHNEQMYTCLRQKATVIAAVVVLYYQ